MGYIRDKGFQSLYTKVMVKGIFDYSLDVEFYKYFVYGKHNQVNFPTSVIREDGIL